MKRFNVFNQIHKALRALLYETAIAFQHTDFCQAEDADRAFEKLEAVLKVFHAHAEHEDGFLLPAVERFNPVLVKEFESEHEKDEFLTHRLRSLVLVFRHATCTSSRIEAGEAIFKAFNEFIAFNLYHMNKEEEKLNASLWSNYTDTEIMAIQKKLIANNSTGRDGIYTDLDVKGQQQCGDHQLVEIRQERRT